GVEGTFSHHHKSDFARGRVAKGLSWRDEIANRCIHSRITIVLAGRASERRDARRERVIAVWRSGSALVYAGSKMAEFRGGPETAAGERRRDANEGVGEANRRGAGERPRGFVRLPL